MKLFANHLPKTLHWVFGALLSVAVCLPLVAHAAASKTAPSKKSRAVVSKAVDQKKVVSAKKTLVSKKSASKEVVAKSSGKDAKKLVVVAKAGKAGKVGKTKDVQLTRAQQRATDRLVARGSNKRGVVVVKKGKERGQATLVASSRKVEKSAPSAFMRVAMAPRLSKAERLGLRDSEDELDLNSSVALVVDQLTGEVLFSKNDSAVLPIASITKLMTGLVLADAHLPMDELLSISQEDVDTFKNSSSRLSVGTTASRGELMHLALMSSENRAAHALGRTYPGGLTHFVRLMNAKARDLGMSDTRFVDPTGLMSQNQSSARDLATLVSAAFERPILRDLSTSPSHEFDRGDRTLQYNNTNRLIRNPEWNIGLQKTGYISEAGRCLVMQANVAGRALIMVFLDASGRSSRVQDAERVRHWVEAQGYRRAAVRPQG